MGSTVVTSRGGRLAAGPAPGLASGNGLPPPPHLPPEDDDPDQPAPIDEPPGPIPIPGEPGPPPMQLGTAFLVH